MAASTPAWPAPQTMTSNWKSLKDKLMKESCAVGVGDTNCGARYFPMQNDLNN
jgi:hypothetical protein